jgi:hypothetical protein
MHGLESIRRLASRVATKIRNTFRPARAGVVLGFVVDLTRTRRELLAVDHILVHEAFSAHSILSSVLRTHWPWVTSTDEIHLQRVLDEYRHYFNEARPHQGIGQRGPIAFVREPRAAVPAGRVVARPIFDGLHHDYRAAA